MTRIPGVPRGPAFAVVVDGEPLPAHRGETIATVLVAAGRPNVFCAIGACQQCLVDVEGRGRVAVCQTPAEPGMRVTTPRA